jgi:hypothetical protein
VDVFAEKSVQEMRTSNRYARLDLPEVPHQAVVALKRTSICGLALAK